MRREDVSGGYKFAARVTTGFDGGNHELHGDLWSCTRCGAVILPAGRELHDSTHPAPSPATPASIAEQQHTQVVGGRPAEEQVRPPLPGRARR